jgi:predicted PurR-regulated permease PerM
MERTNGLQRYVHVMLAVVLTVVTLYFGRSLILLFVGSGLLAFLMLPLARRCEQLLPRWAGTLTATLIMVLVIAGALFFLGWQLSRFGEDLPELKDAFREKGRAFQAYIEDRTNISRREQLSWTNERLNDLADSSGELAMTLFSGTGTVLTSILPIPIFVFLLLLLRDKFRTFFEQLGGSNEGLVLEIMVRISKLSSKYIQGVLTVVLILGVLNSIGYLLLGLKYAILLGFLIGFLNVIPYVGVMLGSLIPIAIALVTKDSPMYALGALGVAMLTQLLENNFITPKIVGSSVSINPLASLIALLGGGMLWGVVGMILAIPITGMLKVACDTIPALRPFGYILGEEKEYPEEQRIRIPSLRRGGRRKR